MEERSNLLQAAAQHFHELTMPNEETQKQNSANELDVYIENLKGLLVSLSANGPNNFSYE